MLGRKQLLKIWLTLLPGFMIGGASANFDGKEADFFRLVVEENDQYCLCQSLSDITETASIRVAVCSGAEAALWVQGENKNLILVAGQDPTNLCLTRSQDGLYVTLCYEGTNDAQSWDFDSREGRPLFVYSKKGEPLTVGVDIPDWSLVRQRVVQ